MSTKITWNDENVAKLVEAVSSVELVTQDMLAELAEDLGGSKRSVGSKIRSMIKAGELSVEVQRAEDATKSKWNTEQEIDLRNFVQDNDGELTYAEIAAAFSGGEFTAKQIQGKVLSMELTDHVKPTEKKEAPKSYNEGEEATYVEMAASGACLEEIAEALGKTVASVRGKGLSLFKEERIEAIPAQRDKVAKEKKDVLEGLDVASMTVEAIAEATGKTPRGIKSMLSRRGVDCEDYKGAAKREKLDAKSEA